MNTGGRQRFDKNQEVRILELDGNVSDSIYLMGQRILSEQIAKAM